MEEALGGICEFCCLCCCEFVASGAMTAICEVLCMCFANSDEDKRNNRNSEVDSPHRSVQESQALISQQPTGNANQTNQTTDVWNISGRVNQDGGAITSEHPMWPTHDTHISMPSYRFSDSLHSPSKDRLPPPPYTEVDLPSYEQATGVPKPKNDIVNVHMTPTRSSTNETAGTSS